MLLGIEQEALVNIECYECKQTTLCVIANDGTEVNCMQCRIAYAVRKYPDGRFSLLKLEGRKVV